MKKYMIWAAVLPLLGGCVKEQDRIGEPDRPDGTTVVKERTVPGQAVIEFDDAMVSRIERCLEEGGVVTKAMAPDGMLEDLGIASLERVFPDAGEYEPRSREMGLHRFYRVRFDAGQPVTKAAEALSEVPGVVSAYPSRTYRKRAFNDPYFKNQWHYVNTTTSGADINVQKVWDQFTVGSPAVIVAVVDEGVDYTHPDLAANMWSDGSGHYGYNFVKNQPTVTYGLSGDIGHGTHVAGTIAAVSNNGIGVAGIAGGDYAAGKAGARIMSCQIFAGEDYADDAACARAIKWGADNGALISQNSWGAYADENDDGYVSAQELASFKKETIPTEIRLAIDYFIKNAGCDASGNQKADAPMKGGIVFFAAGNEDIDYDPICAYEPVVAVGAFGGTGKKSSFSNYGSWVDLGAPGGDDVNYYTSYDIYSTLPGRKYGGEGWQGTSMACPHASGVAALLISYFGGPGFTSAKLKEYLLGGAVDNYFTGTKKIGKKLDAYGAFEYAGAVSEGNRPPRIAFSQADLKVRAHETVTVGFTVTDPEGDAVTVALDKPVGGVELVTAGGYSLRITGPSLTAGNYTVAVKATDTKGASQTENYPFTVLENHAPTLSKGLPGVLFQAGDLKTTIDLGAYFNDADGETLSYAVEASDVVRTSLNGARLTLEALSYGRTELTVTAQDALGLSATGTLQVVYADPAHPVFLSSTRVDRAFEVSNSSLDASVMRISVYSATGSKVYQESKIGSAFDPVSIDMSGRIPGPYTVIVTYRGAAYKFSIVKV